jgi:hypothetical protein
MNSAIEHTMKAESKMLAYCKTILEKMSFDKHLVRKEYRKSVKWLTQTECESLREWIRSKIKKPKN